MDMNNEPVGYVYSVAGEPIKSAKINSEIPNGTPLYTHPAKTLTDEEIIDVVESVFGTFYSMMACNDSWNELAKAILRKAQEK